MIKKIIRFIISCFVILVLGLTLNNKRFENLEIKLKDHVICSHYQADMSNYVIEHYDDILNYCNKVMKDYDYITYKDKFGRVVMEPNIYEDLLNESNLNYFCNYPHEVDFYDDKILFTYDTVRFENGNYAYFYFTFEESNITIYPYVYDVFYKNY